MKFNKITKKMKKINIVIHIQSNFEKKICNQRVIIKVFYCLFIKMNHLILKFNIENNKTNFKKRQKKIEIME